MQIFAVEGGQLHGIEIVIALVAFERLDQWPCARDTFSNRAIVFASSRSLSRPKCFRRSTRRSAAWTTTKSKAVRLRNFIPPRRLFIRDGKTMLQRLRLLSLELCAKKSPAARAGASRSEKFFSRWCSGNADARAVMRRRQILDVLIGPIGHDRLYPVRTTG